MRFTITVLLLSLCYPVLAESWPNVCLGAIRKLGRVVLRFRPPSPQTFLSMKQEATQNQIEYRLHALIKKENQIRVSSDNVTLDKDLLGIKAVARGKDGLARFAIGNENFYAKGDVIFQPDGQVHTFVGQDVVSSKPFAQYVMETMSSEKVSLFGMGALRNAANWNSRPKSLEFSQNPIGDRVVELTIPRETMVNWAAKGWVTLATQRNPKTPFGFHFHYQFAPITWKLLQSKNYRSP